MFSKDMIPKGATHYSVVRWSSLHLGMFYVVYKFFKMEDGEWKVYLTDGENEYPRWHSADRWFRNGCFKPEEQLKKINGLI